MAIAVIVMTIYGVPPAAAEPVLLPPVKGQFDYQLGGAYDPATSVKIVVRDRLKPPATGKYNICYVNTYQTQPDEGKWWASKHPDLLVRQDGKFVVDKQWNEYLLDTSTDAKRAALMEIIGPWFDRCATDGFKGIDADNLDSWTRSKGVLAMADNVAFAKLLVKRAHVAGLAIAQKNASDLAPTGSSKIGFDFAIVEECQIWKECDKFTAAYGGLVYEIEYNDNTKDSEGNPVDPLSIFNAACSARGNKISVIYRDRGLVPSKSPDYVYKLCK
ncbi:endo alpha-1,4 polygalactosaminidase [Rhizobium lusitanum]|uniref:Glycoside-hydrolase family GH114 TIM-barrel domain-containing protein n=1 Tax=Rhizobium lusitanum TaxID=293958 RepID=A0A7X0MH44_9HYPH|nr:endo alpha-1,4 polygalactosaminidase [Rhizobium lusitanum]MBB6488830.1 hypothetical protein [Rhizobium lusitanum]